MESLVVNAMEKFHSFAEYFHYNYKYNFSVFASMRSYYITFEKLLTPPKLTTVSLQILRNANLIFCLEYC